LSLINRIYLANYFFAIAGFELYLETENLSKGAIKCSATYQ